MKFFLPLFTVVLCAINLASFPAYAQISASTWAQGGIRIGTSTSACNSGTEGGVRYSSALGNFESCNGVSWQSMVPNSCDSTPAFFTFTHQVNLVASTQYLSNIVIVTGLDVGCAVLVSVTGQGSPEYRVCSDVACSTVTTNWTTANNTLAMQGKYIQLRATTSASELVTYTATAIVGVINSDWKITTIPTNCSLGAVGTVCTDGTVYAGTSPDGGVPMYVTRCDAGQSWSGSACTGSRTAMDWNNGQGNYSYQIDTVFPNCGSALGCDNSGANISAGLAILDADNSVAGVQNHVAPKYCDDLNVNGYTDWYLPSPPELNMIYANKTGIANFDVSGSSYWVTGESNGYYSWVQTFSTGSFAVSDKGFDRYVRCVRKNVDIIPASLSFTDQTSLTASLSVNSNIFQVTGLTGAAKISILADSGNVLPEYRVCVDAACASILSDWSNDGGLTISSNQYLQLRAYSPAAASSTRNITVIAGGANDIWSLTTSATDPCSAAPNPGAVCVDGTVYAGLSPDGNVAMYVTRCDVGQSWSGSACTGARADKAYNDGNVNYVNTALNDCAAAGGCDPSGETNTTTLVATDSDSVTGGTQAHDAAAYCDGLSLHSQTDWYVPSAPELNVMYANATAIGNLDTAGSSAAGQYGSSSEFDVNSNWLQAFPDGSQIRNYFGATKQAARHIRCARR